MDDGKLKKLLEHFSLVTVGEKKVPNFLWKATQKVKLTEEQFFRQWNYKGGKFKKDGTEIPATKAFGIVTGYDDLECMDVDLKVFSTAQEQRLFWDEYLTFLQDNILDFDEKFVIYKTKNAGFHILYKTKRVQGNLKIASLKGHVEAVLETRGIGGYIFAYPDNKLSQKSYFEIEYISDEDREILFTASRMHNYIAPVPEVQNLPKKKLDFVSDGLTPWDDFNQRNTVWSIVSDSFTEVANHQKKVVIKRHGAESAHSGYIYKDDDLMYLFSTGTIYPHEKPISAFHAYTIKNHNGDFSASAKAIYADGYGERVVKKEQEPEEREVVNIPAESLIFPIDIFPTGIQSYILECNETLDSSIDYMGSSLLWLISLSIGNSMKIEVAPGWREISTIWLAVVGRAGLGKTPSISNIIFPLEKVNNKYISNYIKEYEKFAEFDSLSQKDKKETSEVLKPKKKQFIANDITVEALVDLHQENDNGVGVFKDELAGWFKDMNKYKQGSDLELWLSSWSGKAVNLNRLTRAGSFVASPLIPVLGGIQPTIFNSFYTEENKDNGFMDRMLLSYPEMKVEMYNPNKMKHESIQWYSDTIVSFFEKIKNKYVQRDKDQNIEPYIVHFGDEALIEWERIFNKITTIQNSDEENEYMKSMYPKQKSYIPRFALMIHTFNWFLNGEQGDFLYISKDTMLKAERLSDYFVNMAKKIKVDAKVTQDIKATAKTSIGSSAKEQFKTIYSKDPAVSVSKVAEILGVSKRAIYKYKKEIDNE